jgi:drug/metabolite transporter (DMT)-like permease
MTDITTETVSKTRSRARDLILLLLCNVMFGAQYPATKVAVTNMGPVLLAVLTYLLGLFCLLPFLILENRAHPDQSPPLAVFDKKNFMPFFMATILGFFPASVILAWGIDRSLASNAALLTLSIPIFTAILASIVRDERMTIWRWISFVLGVGGAVICSDIDWKNLSVFGARYLLGNLLILAGCCGSAFTNVYSKDLLERFRPVRLLVLSYGFTGLFCLPLLWIFEPVGWDTLASYPLRTWLGLGILGLFSWGLSMVLLFWLLSRLEVMQVSISFYLISFFGVALAALFLHERISTSIIAGGALVIAGTTLILFSDQKQVAASTAETPRDSTTL